MGEFDKGFDLEYGGFSPRIDISEDEQKLHITAELPGIEKFPSITSKEHPAFLHYPGNKTAAQWMFPQVELTSSFSSFWKRCEQSILTK